MTSVVSGGAGVVLLFCITFILCTCGICCLLMRKRRSELQNEQTRSRSMVYSVTMHDGNGTAFYESVSEFLRNSRTNQEESEVTTRNRAINGKILTPTGLPSYDDVISGKCDSDIEPPPSYSEAANSS